MTKLNNFGMWKEELDKICKLEKDCLKSKDWKKMNRRIQIFLGTFTYKVGNINKDELSLEDLELLNQIREKIKLLMESLAKKFGNLLKEIKEEGEE